MRIAIVGAGGVGGYVGMRLAEAGHAVAWLVRGRTLEALRERGMALESPGGELRLGRQHAADDAAELVRLAGVPEAVVVTPKLYDLEGIAPRLAPLAAPGTLVLPLQNGVEARAILARHLPGATVLGGTLSIKSFVRAPGEIVCKSPFCKIRFGAAGAAGAAGGAPPLEPLRAALDGCTAMTAAISSDIELDLWRKFVMLASFSAVSCMARATIGQVLDDPRARTLLVAAAEEAAAVGRANGIALEDDIAGLVDAQTRDMPREGRPSMLEDLEAGRPLELEFLSGAVVRLARPHGIATPIHAMALAALSMHARGRAAA